LFLIGREKELIMKLSKKMLIGAISAGVLLLLTACTPINSAATIGSKSISVDQIQKSVDEVLKERTKVSTQGMNLETGDALNRSQLSFFVISELLSRLAQEGHISVTDQEVSDEIKLVTNQVGGPANLPAALVNAGIAPSNLNRYFRTYLLSARISNALLSQGISKDNVTAAVQKLVADEAQKLKVSINPRYGTWSATKAAIDIAPLAHGAVTK
jgi:SOS response regulatory protein OraA/RecX